MPSERGWGGARSGAGRRRKPAGQDARTSVATATPVAASAPTVPAEPRKTPQINYDSLLRAVKQAQEDRLGQSGQLTFRPAAFPPKAVPKEKNLQLAMDESISWAGGAALTLGLLAGEGLTFLGYPYLSELAQRPEYRVMSETIADDATRKWISFEIKGGPEDEERKRKDPVGEAERMADPDERKKRLEAAGKMDKVKAIEEDQQRLGVRAHFYNVSRDDGFFGRSHLFYDFGDGIEAGNAELKTSIGDGRNALSQAKVKGKKINRLRTIEPVWVYPTSYNAINPLGDDWYNPQVWYVMGTEVHRTRLPAFVGHPVPDMLKPAYAFGGVSLSQLAKPYVDIWLTTRESVGTLIKSFSVMVLCSDLATLLQAGGTELLARADLFNVLRDNQGLFLINKDTEDFKNVSASLAGLHELQAQAQEHMAAVPRIPIVKFTGLQPAGLNASSEGEIAVYDDTIVGYQNRFIRPELERTVCFQQLGLFGEIDPQITFIFNPLREMTEKEIAEKQKIEAERDMVYVDGGVLSPEEVRKRVIDDPELQYADLDPDDVPDLAQEEEDGLMPGGKTPPGAGGGEGGQGGGESKGAAEDRAIPFASDAALSIIEIAPDVFMLANDEAQFEESKHPRDKGGQFASTAGGGGSSGKSSKGTKSAPKHNPVGAPIALQALKKTGAQMGSNPGGVFESKNGTKYYVKESKSQKHTVNELRAAKLFALTGAPTLQYRPAGPDHVATELQKLDKKSAGELSPAEKKEAQADFVTHAWLANHDAAGTGGDNIGVIGGKVTPLDFGGALEYRAQGEAKANFGDKVTETQTMIDPAISPDAAKLYGDMTPEQLKESAQKVVNISDDEIRDAIGIGPGAKALADKLIARKNDIAKQFNVEFEAKHDRDEKGHFKKMAEENINEAATDPVEMVGQTESLFWDGGTEIYKTKDGFVAALIVDGGFEAAAFFKTKSEAETAAEKMMAAHGAEPASEPTPAKAVPEPQSFKSKKDHVAHLLSKGTTAAEILAATGWPSVSVPAQAKAAGMKLEKTTVNGKTVYMGIPMTDAEKAEAKAAPKPAKTEAPKPAPVAAAAAPAPAVTATPAELEKAKKGTKVPPTGYPVANSFINAFNEKYEGKTISDPAALNEKVAAFKKMQANVAHAVQAEQTAMKEKAEAQAKAQKVKQDAAAKEAAAKNAAVMKDLGITSQEAFGFSALVNMIGGEGSDVVSKFKGYEDKAKNYGYPISGFQCALIANYTNGGYTKVNAALRHGSWTEAQHVYVKMVNKALLAMPKHTGVVRRGTDLEAGDQGKYTVGHVVEERALTSTSANPGGGFGGNTKFHITAIGKRASHIKKLSNHPGEDEVLFAARTFFKVTKVEGKPGGVMTVHMEEMDDDDR